MTTETLNQRFGRCVRALRNEAGLSQTEFGERCGFYQTYLSRIENGQANPTLNAIEIIAIALGLSIYELWDNIERAADDATLNSTLKVKSKIKQLRAPTESTK